MPKKFVVLKALTVCQKKIQFLAFKVYEHRRRHLKSSNQKIPTFKDSVYYKAFSYQCMIMISSFKVD